MPDATPRAVSRPVPAPRLSALGLALAALTASIPAQDARTLEPGASIPEVWPIHTWPDDPTFGPYGTWGAGRDFKANFAADRVSFLPDVGPEEPIVSFDWSTEWVGVEPVSGTAHTLWSEERPATTRTTPTRFTIERGNVRESWDLTAGGIAQSFAFVERPTVDGDLVVRGRVGGERLRVTPTGKGHRALDFATDTGEPIVRYGAAWLVDARGRRTPISTAIDASGALEIRVPRRAWQSAAWPFHIDPIVSVIQAFVERRGRIVRVAAVAARPGTRERIVAVTTRSNATESDLRAFLVDAANNVHPVLALLSTTLSDGDPSAVYAAGSRKFAIAFDRNNSTGNRVSQIRAALVPDTATSASQTQLVFLPRFLSGGFDDMPSASGTITSGLTIAIAARTTTGPSYDPNAVNGRIRGVWLNTSSGQVARGPFLLSDPSFAGYTEPCALPVRDDGEDQFVYTYLRAVGRSTSIHVQRQGFGGGIGTEHTLVQPTADERTAPFIAGADGEYCVGYSAPGTFETRFERFTWPTRSLLPGNRRNAATRDLRIHDLAFDHTSRSHWIAAIDNDVFRIGWNAGVTDQVPFPGTLARDTVRLAWTDAARFAVAATVYSSNRLQELAQVAHYEYPATGSTILGPSCGSGGFLTTTRPTRGDHFFTVRVASGFPGAPAVLLLGLAPGQLPLDAAGFPGCTLWVNPNGLIDLGPVVTAANGTVTLQVPLDDVPDLDLYTQWAVLPPSPPWGVSAGVKLEIR